MTIKSFSYWIWFVALTLLALILANIRLFNLLAFEFCAVLAIAISFAGAHIAITRVQNFRHRPQSLRSRVPQIPTILFWRAFAINLTLLATPLIIILLNAFRVKNCDFLEGFAFFLLLPVVSCVYATAGGTFFGLWLTRRWTACLAYFAYIFVTLVVLVHNLIFHPPVFGYHATFGYFPGPIYDEQISITDTLIIARGTTLLLAWFLLILSASTLEIRRHTQLIPKLRWQKLCQLKLNFEDLSRRILLVSVLGILTIIYCYRGELGLRPTRGYIEKTLGGLRETAHFKIFYERGSNVEREIEQIEQDHEFRYAQLTRYFQIQPKQKILSYVYTSPEQKKRLVGARGTSVEDPLGPGFHINYEPFPHPVMKHELAHALTADWHPILPVSLNLGLHEGIAVAGDWDEGQLTGHQWSKAMRQLGVAPAIQAVMGLGFWGHHPSQSYTLAGSFVRFLVDRYGMDQFKRVFPTGNFRKVYGKPLSDLVEEWETFVETVPLTATDIKIAEYRFKRPSIFQKPCAHKLAALSAEAWRAFRRSDFSAASRLFKELYAFDSNNPRYLRGLMFTHYEMADYPSAAQSATQIIAHPKANVRRRAEAKDVQGDVYWQTGKPELAQSQYQEVFALDASNAVNRGVQAKLAGLSIASTDIQDKVRRILIGTPSSQLRTTLLHEVIDELPTWGLGYYLLGRQLYFNEEYTTATRYLLKADGFGLPHPVLQHENTRLLGLNAYHLKQYNQAITHFQHLAADATLAAGTILNAKDWIQRCEWANEHTRN